MGHKQIDGLQDRQLASCPSVKGGYGCEESKSQLYIRLEGKELEEMVDFFEWGGDLWVGTTSFGVVFSAAAIFTLVATFCLGVQYPA